MNRLKKFTDKDEKSLNKLKEKKRNLNKRLLETEITALLDQSKELSTVQSHIKITQKSFTSNNWKDIGSHLESIAELKKKEQKGLKEIAEERGVELYETDEFVSFIRAADDYIKKIGKTDYPEADDEICIYCRQRLFEEGARELLASYRQLLNDPTQVQLKEHTRLLSVLQTQLKNIDTKSVLRHPSYGKNEKGEPIQPTILKQLSEQIEEFKDLAKKGDTKSIKEKEFDIDYDRILKELNGKIKSITKILEIKNETLSKIEEKEQELDQQINELLDRKILNKKQDDVEKILRGLIAAKILKNRSRSFKTDPLSRKTTAARKNLIAKNFREIFERELKGLRRSNIKVNLNFETFKARSVIKQAISSDYALCEILSESEQKSIALAEFLTEIQLDKNKAPIIFDDPVTSLDHKIIDEVARRLVRLSRERQVIVFTHSILLFNNIKHMSELPRFKDLEYRYYETETDLENTGILYESPTLREDKFDNYRKEINKILHLPKNERDRRENELAIDGYNKLRPAIEVFVEKEMLLNTVKRYRKNIALTSLEKINGALVDKHKEQLTDIFEKCCEYIEAHSNPEGTYPEPTLIELKMDFDVVCKIRGEFVS